MMDFSVDVKIVSVRVLQQKYRLEVSPVVKNIVDQLKFSQKDSGSGRRWVEDPYRRQVLRRWLVSWASPIPAIVRYQRLLT